MDVAIHMKMPDGIVDTPFGRFNVHPGLHALILIPMLQKIADACNQQLLGHKTFYCNPLPLVPYEIPQMTPFGNIPLRPQNDPDLMAIVIALHQLADGLDIGFSAPAAVLGSPVGEIAPQTQPVTPTKLGQVLQEKLTALANRTGVRFVLFSHPNPRINGGDPILRFPELKMYEVSGSIFWADTYEDLVRAVDATLTAAGIIVGIGAMDEYHGGDVAGMLVPNGYHSEPPTTDHPGDGSRDWLATDFVQIVADAPTAATT